MSEVDDQIARSTELLHRTSERYRSLGQRRRERQNATIMSRLGRIAGADFAILIAAMVIGWIIPLGIGGTMLVMALLVAATLGLAIFPTMPEAKPETFHQIPLRILPMKTEQWLETQRGTVPTSAARQLDAIGARLETLSPQLAGLDENTPAASEVRKLVGENLPELINGYNRVPQSLRGTPRNGKTPDQQLAEGLQVIDQEIGQMTEQLAQGDLDLLATRGRYLQIKYRDEEGLESPSS